MALTKLDVINAMLATKGVARLSASDTSHPGYITANDKFDEVDSDFQGKGWWYNSRRLTLLQDSSSGEVFYASNAMSVDPVDPNNEYVMRGDKLKLWDQTNATFAISKDVIVDVVFHEPFEYTPPTVREYIKARCKYEFFLDQDGSVEKIKEYRDAMTTAWAFVNREHLKNADTNHLRGAHGLWFGGSNQPFRANRAVARQPT